MVPINGERLLTHYTHFHVHHVHEQKTLDDYLICIASKFNEAMVLELCTEVAHQVAMIGSLHDEAALLQAHITELDAQRSELKTELQAILVLGEDRAIALSLTALHKVIKNAISQTPSMTQWNASYVSTTSSFSGTQPAPVRHCPFGGPGTCQVLCRWAIGEKLDCGKAGNIEGLPADEKVIMQLWMCCKITPEHSYTGQHALSTYMAEDRAASHPWQAWVPLKVSPPGTTWTSNQLPSPTLVVPLWPVDLNEKVPMAAMGYVHDFTGAVQPYGTSTHGGPDQMHRLPAAPSIPPMLGAGNPATVSFTMAGQVRYALGHKLRSCKLILLTFSFSPRVKLMGGRVRGNSETRRSGDRQWLEHLYSHWTWREGDTVE
ncbi:hypothetical protein K488DRAFT_74885 [Vararia minispora EC-137]|uniref:Uncharacterized protein n=1 Tax=Vararia minispora EC-137 TaxID=1314806 RepID=A0ACB8Q5P7_9AGAM|nr:hypothetical protein K488DRAFT_74885 [Vararia minispora EC-137]